MSRSKQKGFTLIELLVVIAIIAVLTGIGIASFQGAQAKARDAKRKGDLAAIQTALQAYYNDHQQFPPTPFVPPYWCTQISTSNTTWQTQVHDALQPTYIKTIPQDPLYANTSNDYFYYQIDANTYKLYATLENSSDPSYNANDLNEINGICAGVDSNSKYNYEITNP